MAGCLILCVIYLHVIIGIIFLKDFPFLLKILQSLVTQKTIINHTNNLFAFGKQSLCLPQNNIKIRIDRISADIGMSGKQLLIRILNTKKYNRYLQGQRVSTRKERIESLITGCHNQIGLPVTSTLTETTHNDFLRSECPKIRIQIFSRYIHFQSIIFKAFHQTLVQIAMPRSLRSIRLDKSTLYVRSDAAAWQRTAINRTTNTQKYRCFISKRSAPLSILFAQR